jgi:hypothetical protein
MDTTLQAGRSAAESSRLTEEIVDRVIYGHRRVQVDQSFLDQKALIANRVDICEARTSQGVDAASMASQPKTFRAT